MDILAYLILSKALKSFKPQTNPYRLNNQLAQNQDILSTRPSFRRKEKLIFNKSITAVRKKYILKKLLLDIRTKI
jgi:hypothetical protein